jgi:transcriptional regulator with XRE-family HTH domain
MKERLLEFLRNENKSSAQLAEEIGVQASGISHILSGRNNPSLDFILKMLERYQFLSTDWLLFGKGIMYREPKAQGLFDNDPEFKAVRDTVYDKNEQSGPEIDFQDMTKVKSGNDAMLPDMKSASDVVKIVWFYADSTFNEYIPRK